MKKNICCFCKKEIKQGKTNNAEPLIKNGVCCEKCNNKIVITERLNFK